jgi:hypothetical protein
MMPAEFGRPVADETEKWRKVVEFAAVSVELRGNRPRAWQSPEKASDKLRKA